MLSIPWGVRVCGVGILRSQWLDFPFELFSGGRAERPQEVGDRRQPKNECSHLEPHEEGSFVEMKGKPNISRGAHNGYLILFDFVLCK